VRSRHSPVRARERWVPTPPQETRIAARPPKPRNHHRDRYAQGHPRGRGLECVGSRVGATIVPVNRIGYRCVDAWARSFGTVTAFGIEGTGSYGAGLARALREAGHHVLEVNRPDRSTRRRNGKTDMLDARPPPRGPLRPGIGGTEDWHQHRRDDSASQIARDAAVKAKTQAMQTLKSIIVVAPAELREQVEGIRGPITLVRHLASMRPDR